MHLRQIDLNLLYIFHQVMTHRGVSLASEKLNLGASSVSHALARLRRRAQCRALPAGRIGSHVPHRRR